MSRTVAVVGAGASGTLAALHLAAGRLGERFRIVMLDRRGSVGRGAAYSTPEPVHLLNVPACRMSAFSDRPLDFVDWLDQRGHPDAGSKFVARSLFGDYLDCRLRQQCESGRHDVEIVFDDVVDIEMAGRRSQLRARGGRRFAADAVVLATGPGSAGAPTECRQVESSAFFISDPWRSGALDGIRPDDAVVLMGTGLTSVDVILALAARNHRGDLRAISRHGLVPRSHCPNPFPQQQASRRQNVAEGASTLEVFRAFRQCVRDAMAFGGDWRDVVDDARHEVATVWQRLPMVERQRFVRHLERYWDVHRHRMAPAAASRLEELCCNGQLRIEKGRLVSVADHGNGLELQVSLAGPRGPELKPWSTRWLVNCTGPKYGADQLREPLLAQLMKRGLLQPGPLGLGIDTDRVGRAMNREGGTVPWLWAIGPLLRGRLYETTAVPEIRSQAERLAVHLRTCLTAGRTRSLGGRLEMSTGSGLWARPVPAPLPAINNSSPAIVRHR